MKTLTTYLKAFLSLGQLGTITLLMVAAILVAFFSQASTPFDDALDRMGVLNTLENTVALKLSEMQLQEAREIFNYLYNQPEAGSAAKAQQADAAISAELTALQDDGRFDTEDTEFSDVSAELEAFNQARAAHRELFDQTLTILQNEDYETALPALSDLENDGLRLDESLRELIIPVEHDRLTALQAFPEDANTGVQMTVLGLALTLILTLAGYQVIAAAVRPQDHLHNTITAIGGDRMRPATSADLPIKGGAAGHLARALDELARAEQQRNQALKQEIKQLRSDLYESRRRRLKKAVITPPEQGKTL